MTPRLAEDPDGFIKLAWLDWLTTRRWRFLHAVPEGSWTEGHRDDMRWDWYVSTPTVLACGRVARELCIPGLFSRSRLDGLPRCSGCCRATGMPPGLGSPKNDDRCREFLGLPAP